MRYEGWEKKGDGGWGKEKVRSESEISLKSVVPGANFLTRCKVVTTR